MAKKGSTWAKKNTPDTTVLRHCSGANSANHEVEAAFPLRDQAVHTGCRDRHGCWRELPEGCPLGDVPQGGFGRAEADDEGDQAGHNGSAEHETPAVVAKGGDKTVHEKADNIRNAIADGPEDQQPPRMPARFLAGAHSAEQWDAHRIVRADEHTQEKAHLWR